MKKILVTGSNGFIGKNLIVNLNQIKDVVVIPYDNEYNRNYLKEKLTEVDFIFHLAGVNRPERVEDFIQNNSLFTQFIVDNLIEFKRQIPLILSSSTQVKLDNPYGKSKLEAEKHILRYREFGGKGYIYRLTNVFGRWCRPNYNSVVATFCHNIVNGLDINITDRTRELELIHVDDIVADFKRIIFEKEQKSYTEILSVLPSYKVTLGELADLLQSFKSNSQPFMIQDNVNDFVKKLYSTYLSYTPLNSIINSHAPQTDYSGSLFKLFNFSSGGQISLYKTSPGLEREYHLRNLQMAKFIVIKGYATVRLRHILTNEIFVYVFNDFEYNIMEFLPEYTFSVTNSGEQELITLLWSNDELNN